MAWSSWKTIYKKEERSPLDRFKNRNRLLKNFGESGPRVYDALSGSKTSEEIQQFSGMERGEFALIMDFIASNGMASVSAQSSEDDFSPPAMPGGPEDAPLENDDSGSSDVPSAPRRPAGGIRPRARAADDEEDDFSSSLSPLEKIIWDKYGESGVKVYNLIDGEKTAEEILHETGISESKLVEILEFMNDEGIIKLEKPPDSKRAGRRPPMVPPPEEDAVQSRSRKQPDSPDVGFKPMVEAMPSPDIPSVAITQPSLAALTEKQQDGVPLSPDAIPVDVPIMPKMSILSKLKLNFFLMKYGKAGSQIIKKVDGSKDFVDISIETGQTFSNIDIILGDLGKKGLMTFKQLTRNEIAHRYGDDGYAVFKRFGRDGLLIYQLIGKVSSLRDLVAISHIQPDRAAEIILFVHKVLGLDMPLERDMVYRYLER